MQKADKERVVAELAERLRGAESLIVADYRGLSNSQLVALRGELVKHGARFTVVKNTLTRRAASEAGADALLALLEGPTAIAFVESGGDPVAVAKTLSEAARQTRVLSLRGGVLSGGAITQDDVERLAKLPALDVLQAQLVGVIVAPLTQLLALLSAPLQNPVGLIDARIAQLGEPEGAPPAGESDAATAGTEPAPDQPTAAEPDAAGVEAAETDVAEPDAAETDAVEPEVADAEATATDTD